MTNSYLYSSVLAKISTSTYLIPYVHIVTERGEKLSATAAHSTGTHTSVSVKNIYIQTIRYNTEIKHNE